MNWGCYLLQCADGTFYAGITNDMERRLIAHGKGTASKYTRSRLPVRAIYWETCQDRASASRREAEIKKMSRQAKASLAGIAAI